MKAKRQLMIIDLVSRNTVTSQEALCKLLQEHGIKVTQATVSRDIKELNLIRIPSADGRYKYALMPGDPSLVYRERFRRILIDCCVTIEKSGNLILVKAITATGPAVGEAIDGLNLPGVLGTVAGDNVVLAVVKENWSSGEVLTALRDIAGL